jgi:hypothetical protein
MFGQEAQNSWQDYLSNLESKAGYSSDLSICEMSFVQKDGPGADVPKHTNS